METTATLINKLATMEHREAYNELDSKGRNVVKKILERLNGPNRYLEHSGTKINIKYALISLVWSHGNANQKSEALEHFISLFEHEKNKTMLIGFTNSFFQHENDSGMRKRLVRSLLSFLEADLDGSVTEQRVPWRYWLAGLILASGIEKISTRALHIIESHIKQEEDALLAASILVSMSASATERTKDKLAQVLATIPEDKLSQDSLENLRKIIHKG